MKSFQSTVVKFVLILAILGGLGFGGWYAWHWWSNSGNGAPEFRSEKVTRGKLTATISSTGTLQPEEVIDVGAQVVGQIKYFGRDPADNNAPIAVATAVGCFANVFTTSSPVGALWWLGAPSRERGEIKLQPILAIGSKLPMGFKLVDYNTQVEEDTVLAQLDDAKFRAAVNQARAAREKFKANVASAKANLASTSVLRENLEKSGSGATAEQVRVARLTEEAAESAVKAAQEELNAAQEALKAAEIDLNYTIIRSPAKGVIVDRRVNVGQTVVASLSAPSLFLIAKDLTRMQVWVQVNEADIGDIKAPDEKKGQKGTEVTFTVDTFPHEVFEGKVSQIRLNATMTQNVVTYTVVVDTDNRDKETGDVGKLKPYLTANLQFQIKRSEKDFLTVPNAALRYSPAPSRVHPEHREAYEARRKKAFASEEKPKVTADPKQERPKHNHGTVWIEEDGFVRPLRVTIGLTDGKSTEILEVKDGELTTDMAVVVGENLNKLAKGGDSVNPFAPPPVFGKKGVK